MTDSRGVLFVPYQDTLALLSVEDALRICEDVYGMHARGSVVWSSPASFKLEEHGLKKLRVDSFGDLVFGTLSPEAPPLANYIGNLIGSRIHRVLQHGGRSQLHALYRAVRSP